MMQIFQHFQTTFVVYIFLILHIFIFLNSIFAALRIKQVFLFTIDMKKLQIFFAYFIMTKLRNYFIFTKFGIIMLKNHSQQNQKLSEDIKIVKRIYQQKFSKSHSAELMQKKRIAVFQFKKSNENEDSDIYSKLNNQKKSKLKSKSVGSLLPKIKQIEMIAKSQKSNKQKQKSKELTSFELYLSQKFIKKQEQHNLLFLTQSPTIIPDKVINEKFNQFLVAHYQNRPKNLRALLSLAGGFQNSQEAKHRKVEEQKNQLELIAKNLIEQQNKLKSGPQIKQQSDQQQSIEEDIKEKNRSEGKKNINWVLSECKKYQKRFKVNKKKKRKEGERGQK